MARKRMIDPEFWSDEQIGHWSFEARLFYIALWNFADDEGRFKAHPKLLKAQIFPYDDKLQIDKLKKEISTKIQWYAVEGLQYGHIHNFLKYQRIDRPAPSRLPTPTDDEQPRSLTKELIGQIKERDKGLCQYCGKKNDDIVIDHIIPWARGGRHNPENLAVACRSCNSIKRDKLLTEMKGDFIKSLYNKGLLDYSKKNIEASKDIPPKLIEVKLSKDKLSIVDDLNLVLGTNYKPTNAKTKELIQARLNDGFGLEDFKVVHRKMLKTWGADQKMVKYLRPITLYGNKFEGYLNQKEVTTKLTQNGINAYLIGQEWLKKEEAKDVR